MGHSKNDIPFEGGFARISIKKISDKQNATFMLINPATRKPYINQEIIRDLQIRKSQYPMLTPQIDLQIKWLQNRVENNLNQNVNSTSCEAVKAKTKPRSVWKKNAIHVFGILLASCFVPFGMHVFITDK